MALGTPGQVLEWRYEKLILASSRLLTTTSVVTVYVMIQTLVGWPWVDGMPNETRGRRKYFFFAVAGALSSCLEVYPGLPTQPVAVFWATFPVNSCLPNSKKKNSPLPPLLSYFLLFSFSFLIGKHCRWLSMGLRERKKEMRKRRDAAALYTFFRVSIAGQKPPLFIVGLFDKGLECFQAKVGAHLIRINLRVV